MATARVCVLDTAQLFIDNMPVGNGSVSGDGDFSVSGSKTISGTIVRVTATGNVTTREVVFDIENGTPPVVSRSLAEDTEGLCAST